ncbi:hypothetical protein DAT299_04700 [Streptococcus suis]|nr:hypothetical protein DAT299_04700 [Streptococcus suis]
MTRSEKSSKNLGQIEEDIIKNLVYQGFLTLFYASCRLSVPDLTGINRT